MLAGFSRLRHYARMNTATHSTRPKICVLGLGVGAPDLAAYPELDGATCILGSRAALAQLASHPAEKLAIVSGLSLLLDRVAAIREAGGRVVVLASGDPLFFGIGATLVRRFGPEALDIRPAVSSLQAAAARIALPWSDVSMVSLHGRTDFLPLAHAVLRGGPVCLLTDDRLPFADVAAYLLERGVTEYRAHVFGRLGFPEESYAGFALEEAGEQGAFPSPNTVLLVPGERPDSLPCPLLGRPDEEYAHAKGLITKWPVRAAALGALRIAPDHTVWDLGAGSGSVAIEAAALAWQGQVIAVERKPERVAFIQENRRRFRVPHLDIVAGALPESLPGLPDPDRIFIGGGLGRERGGEKGGETLLRESWARLKPGGRLVASCVLLESLETARSLLASLAGHCDVLCLNASQSSPLAGGTYCVAQNPVFLVSATT